MSEDIVLMFVLTTNLVDNFHLLTILRQQILILAVDIR